LFSAVASTSESTTVSGTLMSRKMPTLPNDRMTAGSLNAATKLSSPTNGRSTCAPGAAKKKSWKAIQNA
jgi:hypothetical protein